jgi:hypothetical protein
MSIVEQEVPPLSAGDYLTRKEFMRRWEEQPGTKFAELIGGVVYMPSPLAVDHGDSDNDAGTWIGVYKAATQGTAAGQNETTYLLEDVVQPDLNLRILPEYGGSSRKEGLYLAGKPEFIMEICRTSAAYDLHQKRDVYEAAGIPEYLAVLLFEKEIRWHVLIEGKYQLTPPGEDGIWRSRIFPGLWLDGQAFLGGDLARVLAKLQDGLRSPEHQAFVEKLAPARRSH